LTGIIYNKVDNHGKSDIFFFRDISPSKIKIPRRGFLRCHDLVSVAHKYSKYFGDLLFKPREIVHLDVFN
jgi:hypothetical protein